MLYAALTFQIWLGVSKKNPLWHEEKIFILPWIVIYGSSCHCYIRHWLFINRF